MTTEKVKPDRMTIFRCKFSKVFLLFVILTKFSESDATNCILSNRQVGKCKYLRDCRSALVSLREGNEPEYCNYQQESVCCLDANDEVTERYEGNQREVGSRSPKQQEFSVLRDTHEIVTENVASTLGFGPKRTNFAKNSFPEVARRNNPNGEKQEIYDNTPNNLYNNRERNDDSWQSDDLSSSRNFHGYYNGGSFEPPGQAKKKPWDKTTPSAFYYENVSKKPNHKGPNKYNNQNNQNSNFHGGNYQQPWPPQRTTRRPEWFTQSSNYPVEWNQNHNQNWNAYNQWTTTKNSVWNQETTTVRNQYFENFNSGNIPSVPQQGSKPHENRPGTWPSSHGRLRLSELKCLEYSKEVTENITGLPLTTDPNPVIIPVRKCVQAQQLIVGGENTTVGEFPHMAAIGFRDRNKQGIAWNCGGTLISDLFVLTAAHCTSTSSGRPVKVRLGEYNLMKNDDGAYPVDYGITEIIIHPDYKPPSKYHDIALLKLSRRVKFFKHIRPACLYLEDTLSTTKAVATGWGRMFYDGNVSDVLQKVVLNIVDKATCNRLYKVNVKTEVLSRGIVDSQLCAGELSGGKDTCQGDSGGPLSITNTKCIHHIIGVTSFGKSCALPNSTGVYTKVSSYVPWIESVIWPQGK